jgi:hypothetical protein
VPLRPAPSKDSKIGTPYIQNQSFFLGLSIGPNKMRAGVLFGVLLLASHASAEYKSEITANREGIFPAFIIPTDCMFPSLTILN